jgi:H+/Cl- antiporter ClcA
LSHRLIIFFSGPSKSFVLWVKSGLLRWLLFSAAAGALVGICSAFFLAILWQCIGLADRFQHHYFLLPITMLCTGLVVKYFAPQTRGYGNSVIQAVHEFASAVRFRVAPVTFFGSIVAIAAGGSAGEIGPCYQTGAAILSSVSGLLKLRGEDRRILVVSGISAGFAAVVGTPVAGALFGVEILCLSGLVYELILPAAVASSVSYLVASYLGVNYIQISQHPVPSLEPVFFLAVCGAGLFFGMCSFLFTYAIRWIAAVGARIRRDAIRGLIGGLILLCLALALSPSYLGLSHDILHRALEGGPIPPLSFASKMLFTSITLGFGGIGGIVSPIMFTGATAGNLFGSLLGLEPGVFAALGTVALLAGATNTPLAAAVAAVELFGLGLAPYSAVVCAISYAVTAGKGIYSSQILC